MFVTLRVAVLFVTLGLAASVNAQTKLWGGLVTGMSPEQAKVVLESKAGVDRVTIKSGKRGRQLDINTSTFEVGGFPARIRTDFQNDRLSAVTLHPSQGGLTCLPVAVSIYERMSQLLDDNYNRRGGSRPTLDEVNLRALALRSALNKRYRPDPDTFIELFSDDVTTVYLELELSRIELSSIALSCRRAGSSAEAEGWLVGGVSLRYVDRKRDDAARALEQAADTEADRKASDSLK